MTIVLDNITVALTDVSKACLEDWMKLIIKEGPKYGYNLELTKCHLVVAPQFIEQATCLFSEFGVNVVQGQRFLGGFVGAKDEANQWASEY